MRKFLPKYFIILGGLGLTWFVLPIILYQIFIIGNIVGMALFFFILLYGLNFDKVNSEVKKLWNKKSGKAIISAALIVILGVITVAGIETGLMIEAAGQEPQANSTAVVLGCKANGSVPSRMLLKRLQAAKKFLDENPEAVCIVSGGQGTDEIMSEAECMYGWLVKNGIDSKRLYKESESTSTRENLDFSKRIIEDNGLDKEITIITNEFHQYRAGRIADSLGIEYSAVSGMTPVVLFPTYFVRELFAILYEWIR